MNNDETKLPAKDAKQGRKGFPGLRVLIFGLALAALAAIFFTIG